MSTGNEKIRIVVIETGVILTLCGIIWGIAWAAICENRREIGEVKDSLTDKISIIQKDVAFIRGKME